MGESIARRVGLESTIRPRGRRQVRNLPNKDSCYQTKTPDTFVCFHRLDVDVGKFGSSQREMRLLNG
jgi:hypothetical protein